MTAAQRVAHEAALWRAVERLAKHNRVVIVDRGPDDGASVYVGSHELTMSDGSDVEDALTTAARKGGLVL